jgi:UDP-glucose 4-epimerase
MRVLVTGGFGYLGSRIAAAMVEQGPAVRVLDVADPAERPPPSGNAAAEALAGIEYVRGDVASEDTCRAACRTMDVVVHSAAIHQAGSVARRPQRSIEVNVHGTHNVVRGAAAEGASRLVLLSSAKVYGEPERLPSAEDDLPRPTDTYGLSKTVSEYYCQRLREATGLDAVIVRPFSVYGPGQDLSTGYIGMLVKAILDQENPVFPGLPSFLRDFVYVDDAVEVCVRAALHGGPLPGVLNAGSGRSVSLRKLVDLASAICSWRVLPTFVRPARGAITRTQACMDRSRAALGLGPRRQLEDGLRLTLGAFLGEHQCAPARIL